MRSFFVICRYAIYLQFIKRGSLNLGWKSVADEREVYKGTLSEETPIEKEHNGWKSYGFPAVI